MPLTRTALVIAANLAILTYNIGVLIYMLPIPSRRIKRLAPKLIEDGIYSAILVTSFATMLYISDLIASMSTVTLADIADWLNDVLQSFLSQYLAGKMLAALAAMVPGAGAAAAIAILPWSIVIFGILSSTGLVLALIYIVSGLKAELTALGIALYALPFRIGRNAGASLIAFAIIGNIALHFLPHWMIFILNGSSESWGAMLNGTYAGSEPGTGYYAVWGLVSDSGSSFPHYGVVVFKGPINASYPILGDGSYYATQPPLVPGTYSIELEYAGVRITPSNPSVTVPDDLSLTYDYSDVPYRLDISLPSKMRFIDPQGVIYSNCGLNSFNEHKSRDGSNDVYTISFTGDCGGYSAVKIVVTMPDECMLTKVESDKITSSKIIDYIYIPWRGVPISYYRVRFSVYNSPFNVIVQYQCPAGLGPRKPELPGAQSSGGLDIEASMPTDIIVFGLAYTTSIYAYLAIMSMLVAGFASFLGAYAPRVVFRG